MRFRRHQWWTHDIVSCKSRYFPQTRLKKCPSSDSTGAPYCVHVVCFIVAVNRARSLDELNWTERQIKLKKSITTKKIAPADVFVFPVCSHTSCDDGTKTPLLATQRQGCIKESEAKRWRVQMWMTQIPCSVIEVNLKTCFPQQCGLPSHIRQPFFTLNTVNEFQMLEKPGV